MECLQRGELGSSSLRKLQILFRAIKKVISTKKELDGPPSSYSERIKNGVGKMMGDNDAWHFRDGTLISS